jgi:hypothetical protein
MARRGGAGVLALAAGMAFGTVPAMVDGGDKAPAGILLLPGYTVNQEIRGAPSWEIRSPKGLRAYGEAGSNQGSWVGVVKNDAYVWYREQTVDGWLMRVALVKVGATTVFDDLVGRPADETVLLVSFVPEGRSYYGANFVARVSAPEDVVDILLMMMTAKPAKVGFNGRTN